MTLSRKKNAQAHIRITGTPDDIAECMKWISVSGGVISDSSGLMGNHGSMFCREYFTLTISNEEEL